MDDLKVLIGIGVGLLALAPVFKVGRECGVSAVGALARHTVLHEEAGQIDEVMVEDAYESDFRKVFDGERHPY